MSTLVIDVGTSSVRAMVFDAEATVTSEHHAPLPVTTPAPGRVEFDPAAMASTTLDLARQACDQTSTNPVTTVGIATQRSSAVLWDAATGEPLGPGLSWQDLRTARACQQHHANGLQVAPNQAATKFEWLLDTYLPDRTGGTFDHAVRLGTVDSWIAWTLSPGLHVTEPSNACVTGLWSADPSGWNTNVVDQLRIPGAALPAIVDSIGPIGAAHALQGSPTLLAILGDQQASMLGQGCVEPGMTKCTFGTGAMLNVCGTTQPPPSGSHGTFPLVAWTQNGVATWATEAIMLSAGSCVEWLRDSLGIVDSVDELNTLAASCPDTGGAIFVPDLAGAGTPQWDFSAAGALFGLTRGTSRAQICRAVLEGIAHRGADLFDAAIADADHAPDVLRIDGGVSQSPVFVQALANATGVPIQRSNHVEATALGAALAVARSMGQPDHPALTPRLPPAVDPAGPRQRERWADALSRSGRWS